MNQRKLNKVSSKISLFDAIQTPSEKRIETLSDGVFAVAMTLLILDIKLPEISNDISSREFTNAVWDLWPKVGVFILSFVVLARAWELHRYVFNFLIRYDHTLIYLNMLYLMALAFLPFSTSLVGQHSTFEISAAIYATNFLAIGGTKFVIWNYATHHHRLVPNDMDPALITWLNKRLALSTGIICIAILTAFIYPKISILLLLVYQVLMVIIPFFRQSLPSVARSP